MSNSINTNIAAFYAQENITTASNASSENVARLSSGNAIVEASDNVAALAIGTSLGSQVNVLTAAQTNASQGTSLLQVADGALAQIQQILQQQQSLANQAQSGTLTDTDRGFLNQQFSQLTNEIDALAQGTTFNGVSLINGSIAGGASINTNTTNGSTSLPATATVATIANSLNVSSGNTFTITVAGQPAETLTFGTGAGQVGIGATSQDTMANLAQALNNSGLAQLSDFRFASTNSGSGATLSAYYTGATTGINNIPALTIGNTGTALTATASPTFSAATSIGSLTGTVAAGDTFTIGSHTITFDANNTNPTTGYATTTTGNGEVDIGTTSLTNGITGTALTNLVSFLNSVAGTAGWTDITGIAFSTNSTGTPTNLYAAYSGGGSTQPTLSTTYTANSANVFSNGTASSIGAATGVFTVGNEGDIVSGQTVLNIGGAAISFGVSSSGLGTNTATVVNSTSLTTTLANVVSYLNGAYNSSLTGNYAGLTFDLNTSNDTIYAVNNTGAQISLGNTTITQPLPASDVGLVATTVTAAGSAAVITLGGTNLIAGNTISVNGLTLTMVANGVAPGSHQIAVGTNVAGTLAALVTYFNTNAVALGFSASWTGTVFTAGATTLIATNNSGGALDTPTIVLGASNPADAAVATSATLAAASTAGTFSGTAAISAGSQLTVGTNTNIASDITSATTFDLGGDTITFGNASAVASGAAKVLIGSNNPSTLANLATYLNTASVNAGLGQNYKGLTFGSTATQLTAVNTTGSDIITGATAPTLPTGSPVGSSLIAATQTADANSGNTLNVLTLEAGPEFSSATTVSIGGKSVTFGAAGSSADVVVGANNLQTLTNLAAYLNTTAVKTSLANGYNDATYTTDGTNLIATANTGGAALIAADISFSAGTPTGATALGSDTTLTVGQTANVLTMGIDTLVFGTSSQVTAGTANVAQGTNLTASLANAATYLNSVTPASSKVTFSSNGTNLLGQNNQGSTTSLTSYFNSTDPVFTGVTGQIVTASGVVGLGAGVTSALGTPTGSLFVQDTGTTASNYGNGVDLSSVANNADFVGAFGGAGTIGAITANYINTGLTSTSGVQFSVVVGNDTYTTDTIENSALDGTAPVPLLFTGDNTTTSAPEGGSFTLTLQPQAQVNSQNDASQLATGINAALSSVNAYQNRNVLSYNNNYSAEVSNEQTATLAGSSVAFNSDNFTSPVISSVSVAAPSTGSTDAVVTAVINGDTYTTGSGIGDNFGANDTIVLQNESNPDQTLTLTLGAAGSANLSNASDAAAFQTALSSALGINTSTGGLTFQLGATASANVSVVLASATSNALFTGTPLNISTANGASTAATVVTNALNTVTAQRATTGAYESQFNFASAALQSSVQNETAAESQLLDTNIATESTAYATNQVKLQAGISVLAQANQQTQALLKLIG